MPENQEWFYYVPVLLQDKDGKIGFTAHIVKRDSALNSVEAVHGLIDSLTQLHCEVEPEPGTMPVLPLMWTLITAKRGPAVEAQKRGTRKPTRH